MCQVSCIFPERKSLTWCVLSALVLSIWWLFRGAKTNEHRLLLKHYLPAKPERFPQYFFLWKCPNTLMLPHYCFRFQVHLSILLVAHCLQCPAENEGFLKVSSVAQFSKELRRHTVVRAIWVGSSRVINYHLSYALLHKGSFFKLVVKVLFFKNWDASHFTQVCQMHFFAFVLKIERQFGIMNLGVTT